MRVKSSARLTLKDRLSRLSFVQAQKPLGPEGAHWLAMGGKMEIDTAAQVRLTEDSCRVTFPDASARIGDKRDPLVVRVALHPGYRDRLQIGCNRSGDEALLHQGAALALILEEKTSLGLAAAPIEDTPWELLSEQALEARALAEREQRAGEEKMTVKSADSTTPWTDYLVASAASGKTYRNGPGKDHPGRGHGGIARPPERNRTRAHRLPRLAQITVARRDRTLLRAQRIKNWQAKTSRIIKGLRSPFALVLTGTPLENRLDDLYSVVEFIDDRRLGPAYRFINRHRVATDTGKVLGYKNLAALRRHLKPVLLRRTRASVAQELPPRTTEIVRITPTDEQLQLHDAQMQVVQSITRKSFLTEMDLLRLQKALLLARMSANSTFLVDKQPPGYSTKIERVGELLDTLCAEPGRKLILFSEWTTMLDLIEPLLKRFKADFVRLDGSVPQKQRSRLVATFQSDAKCRAFLTTNAGSTGLNLQAADTVINLELPWNPALLERRIARAHRMGQKRPVQVYLMVTENTIDENLLATLSAKHELAAAVLDPDSELGEVQFASGIEELKRRLEALLGARPEAPSDASMQQRAEAETAAPAPQAVAALRAGLQECVETATYGKLRLGIGEADGGA